MRLLLDACVPKGLRRSLSGYEVQTAHEMGWGDLDNGDLLDAMQDLFDALELRNVLSNLYRNLYLKAITFHRG